ncbi:MAG: OmpH family outer membrane protein [Pedobacter sp.]|nr:MAG: OmpH family outer membrane protein [Pedobacter sp.]
MKKLILLIVLSISIYQAKAQLAIINGKKVTASMSEFAKIDTAVAKETAGYSTEYKRKQVLLNKLITTADSLFKIDTKGAPTMKAIADAQIADRALKAYSETANKKLADFRELLTKPYTEKVMAAIKAVANRGKYMQVIDVSVVSMVYVNPLSDITTQVINELKAK